MYIDIIFHSPQLPRVSPAVAVWWPGRVIDLLNLIPWRVWSGGDMPEGRCAAFIGACAALPQVDADRLEVRNVPVAKEWLASADPREWYARLLEDMRGWAR